MTKIKRSNFPADSSMILNGCGHDSSYIISNFLRGGEYEPPIPYPWIRPCDICLTYLLPVIVPWHQVIQNVIEELFANHRQGFTARNVFRLQPFPSIKSARGKENIRSFLLMQDKSPAIRYIIHPLHNTDIILQDDKFYNFTYLQNVYWVFSFIPDSDLNGTPLRTVG